MPVYFYHVKVMPFLQSYFSYKGEGFYVQLTGTCLPFWALCIFELNLYNPWLTALEIEVMAIWFKIAILPC